ncbi:MAG TPA: hypothetical protein VLG76_03275 [Rhabdochlamydiaceae bacterium]|nr:hypothetical protein [Rhabdochlamydiaceae bacterium]
MTRKTNPRPSQENFWNEKTNIRFSSKKSLFVKDLLNSIDEAPDFHDPFSELNLFLSQKVKQEMCHCGNSKKWSVKLQDDLIQKITPEFQKKFPQYRLGVSALKKTWEKVSFYSQQIQHQKEALTQAGKLNISFFIKENLKSLPQLKNTCHIHPYHFAHQLALKMSECIATVDGVRPKLDELTQMIWSIQRHLIPNLNPQHFKSPYDEYDKIDKLIVKTILEISAKHPQIAQKELAYQVKESLQYLHDLPDFPSIEKLTCNLSALLAEKLYPSSPFHTQFLGEEKEAIIQFLKRQINLCKTSHLKIQHHEIIRRIIALYTLACGLPKDLSDEKIHEAIDASYPIHQEKKPDLPQALYAFISAQTLLIKNDALCHSPDYIKKMVLEAYQEAKLLREADGQLLEIVIWKIINETDGILDRLPYRIGQKIEEEIAGILIDDPHLSFSNVIQEVLSFFKKIKELSLHKNVSEIDNKIHVWTMQSDMLLRWVHLNHEIPLLKLISQKWADLKNEAALSYQQFVSEVCQAYLQKYPRLASYAPQVTSRIWTLFKYNWYTLFSQPEESSFDRFLKWHGSYLLSCNTDKEQILIQLEELCKRMLPLVPFDSIKAQGMFNFSV